uniref:Uncharacterized protein n=1 Tax=Arundo donax TaxID=35708 RepID=A0A0A9G3S0_ARUDO
MPETQPRPSPLFLSRWSAQGSCRRAGPRGRDWRGRGPVGRERARAGEREEEGEEKRRKEEEFFAARRISLVIVIINYVEYNLEIF